MKNIFLTGPPTSNVIKFLTFFITSILVLGYASRAFASDEWQYWNKIKLKHSYGKKLDAHFNIEQKFLDDFNHLGTHNYAPGVVFKINKYFDFELNYKYETVKGEEEWSEEHRLELIPTINWILKEYKIQIKSRFEHRIVEEENKWVWREKLKTKKQIKIGIFEFTLFISEAIFFDFKINEFNQNRFAIGLSKTITKNLGIDLYYMRKNNKRDGAWPGVNILGTEFAIKF